MKHTAHFFFAKHSFIFEIVEKMGSGQSVQKHYIDHNILCDQAKHATQQNQFHRGVQLFNEALESAVAVRGAEDLEVARVHARRGDLFLRRRTFDEAVEAFTESQRIMDKCRRTPESAKPSSEEYKALLSNLAFAQYTSAQRKPKASKEFRELNQSALQKFTIVSQMKSSSRQDSAIAETLTLVGCIQMNMGNLRDAKATLIKVGDIQKKQGVPVTGTRRLFKSVSSALVTTNAAVLIQRKIRRKLRWIRFRKLQARQRECMEDEETEFRHLVYLFEDDCSLAWRILFFIVNSTYEKRTEFRVERIKEMISRSLADSK